MIYNTLELAQDAILSRDYKKIFLVTNRDAFELSGAEERLKPLLDSGKVTRFCDFSPNPKFEDIMKGVVLYNELNPDLVIGVGGGSAMDMAKMIRGIAKADNPLKCAIGKEDPKSNLPPLIVAPTTAGTGSEITPFAAFYVEGIKYSFHNDFVLPDELVMDQTLAMSLPPLVTAFTAMDAFGQGIESYWSVRSTEKSRKFSKKAIKLIYENVHKAVNNPDLGTRESMMWGANYAGKAIAIAQTTACHSISYPMTSRFGVPHGHAVGLTLGAVLEYNAGITDADCVDPRRAKYVRKAIGEIVEMLGAKDAADARYKITQMIRNIGLETRLSERGIDIDTVVKEGFNPARMKNNPRHINETSLREILGELK